MKWNIVNQGRTLSGNRMITILWGFLSYKITQQNWSSLDTNKIMATIILAVLTHSARERYRKIKKTHETENVWVRQILESPQFLILRERQRRNFLIQGLMIILSYLPIIATIGALLYTWYQDYLTFFF